MDDKKSQYAYVGLGGNLGNVAGAFDKAIETLGACPDVRIDAVSDYVKTSPLGDADQPDYLNAVAKIETSLEAVQLLELLHLIEDKFARDRTERWGSRTLDLDLLLYGDSVIETEKLCVPHRQMHLRTFVLAGLCQIYPGLMHPILNRTVAELADRLNGRNFCFDLQRPQLISVAGLIGAGKTTLADGLSDVLGCSVIKESYNTNPFLPKVYAGRVDLAIDSQLFFLNSRAEQISSDLLAAGQAAITDYVFDKDLIFARRTLVAEDLKKYMQRYEQVSAIVSAPVLMIHLSCRPEVALGRIHQRNRPYEQSIDIETLRSLSDEYDSLFADWQASPLIRLDAEEFNCLDVKDVEILAKEVKSYIC